MHSRSLSRILVVESVQHAPGCLIDWFCDQLARYPVVKVQHDDYYGYDGEFAQVYQALIEQAHMHWAESGFTPMQFQRAFFIAAERSPKVQIFE